MSARTFEPNPPELEHRKTLTISKIGKEKYLVMSAHSVFTDGSKMAWGGVLGRYQCVIQVTAPADSIFSAIRETVDKMGKRLGRKLEFAIEDRSHHQKVGKTVTQTCFVYDPCRKPAQTELDKFKQD